RWLAAAAALSLMALGCGYRVAGRGDLLPNQVRTIAVPAFANATTRYQFTEGLPLAIGRDFITRTRYRVVAKPENADAVLEGAVASYFSYPTVFDAGTGRASGVQLIVVLDIKLVERKTGSILFHRPNMQVQNRYEISADQEAYFDESDMALKRVSADVARTVVSAILENF
ncbi:MAG: LptE family protein, partial [bacterium]|nr:LptE family protein [bacterium]